jgi:hypothetical protein
MRGATFTVTVRRGPSATGLWGAKLAVGAAVLAALGGCGGGKGADSPGTCPEGTTLKGSDCIPSDPPTHTSDARSDDSTPSGGGSSASSASSAVGSTTSAGTDATPSTPSSGPSSGKPPYDKDSVEIELKRASRQIKANCGSATDDSGSAPGPWGKTSASLTLGRNGHVKDVSVPAPYDGAPDGVCAANAFKKIQFPPYSSSSDVVIQWDVELVKPKH